MVLNKLSHIDVGSGSLTNKSKCIKICLTSLNQISNSKSNFHLRLVVSHEGIIDCVHHLPREPPIDVIALNTRAHVRKVGHIQILQIQLSQLSCDYRTLAFKVQNRKLSNAAFKAASSRLS